MKLQAFFCLVLWRCAIVAVAISYQIEDEEIMDNAAGKEEKRDQTPVIFTEASPENFRGIQADSLAGNNQASITPTVAKEVAVKELENEEPGDDINAVKQTAEPNDMSHYDKEDINFVKNSSSPNQALPKAVRLSSLTQEGKVDTIAITNPGGKSPTVSKPKLFGSQSPEGQTKLTNASDDNSKESSVKIFDLPDSKISEMDKNLLNNTERLLTDSNDDALEKLRKSGERLTMFYDHDVNAAKKVELLPDNIAEKKIAEKGSAKLNQHQKAIYGATAVGGSAKLDEHQNAIDGTSTVGMKGGQIAGGQITGGQITGGNIFGGVISGGIIDGGTIKGGDIKGGHMTGGLLDGGLLMDGTVEGGVVHNGTIRGGDVKAGNITGGVITGGVVLGGHVSDGIVKGGVLKKGGVEGGVLLGGTVDGGILKGGVMESGRLLGGIVRNGRVTGGTILGGEVLGGEVGEGVIIRGGKINGTVTVGRKIPSHQPFLINKIPTANLPVPPALPKQSDRPVGDQSIGGRIPVPQPPVLGHPLLQQPRPDVIRAHNGNGAIVVPTNRRQDPIALSKVTRPQNKRDYQPNNYFNQPNPPVSTYSNPSYGQDNYAALRPAMNYARVGNPVASNPANIPGYAGTRTFQRPLAVPLARSRLNGININQFVKQVSVSSRRSPSTSNNDEVKPDYHWILNQIKNGEVDGIPGKNLVAQGGIRLNRASIGFDGAATFLDGGDYERTCVSDPNLCEKGISYEITIKMDPEATNYREPRYILDTGASSFNSRGIALYTLDNKLRADVAIRDKSYCLAVPLTTDKWQDIVVTYNKDGELNMYINCKLAATVEDDKQCINCHTPGCHNSDRNTKLVLGRSNSEPRSGFARFKAGDLSIYERYLYPQDIDQICGYTKRPAKPSPLSTNFLPTFPRQRSPVASSSILRTQSGFSKSGISNPQRKIEISQKVPYFSPWSSWSRCSSSCATGTMVRQRSCIYTHAQSGWQTCHGVTFQAKKCSSKCPDQHQKFLKKANRINHQAGVKKAITPNKKPEKSNQQNVTMAKQSIGNTKNSTIPVSRRNRIGKILKKLGSLLGRL